MTKLMNKLKCHVLLPQTCFLWINHMQECQLLILEKYLNLEIY